MNALGGDVTLDESSLLVNQQIERVATSDIDGPSDFTVNMVEWMKGDPKHDGENDNTAAKSMSSKHTLPPTSPHAPSDDEGPSDFTLNMFEWMNGNKKTAISNTMSPQSMATKPTPLPPSSSAAIFADSPSDSTLNIIEYMNPSSALPARKILTPRLAIPKTATPPATSRLASAEETIIRHPSLEPQTLLQPTVEDYHTELFLTPIKPASAALSPLLVTPSPPHRASPPAAADATQALRAQLEKALAANELLRHELRQESNSRLRLQTEISASRLRVEATARAAATQIRALEDELLAVRTSFAGQATAQASAHRQTLAEVRAVASAQATTSHNEVQSAARASLASAQSASAAAIFQLETAHAAGLHALEDRLAATQAGLGSTQETLASTTAALATTRDELSAQADLNASFDAQISSRLRAREEKWQRKLQRLEEERSGWKAERAVMAKALLRQFGREECGIGGEEEERAKGQRYAYKY